MGGPPPGYGPPPGMGGPGVVIDVGKTDGRKAVIGAIVAGVIGMIAVISSLAGGVDGGGAGVAVGLIFGVLFLLPALFVVIRRNKVFRPRKLVFEPAGLRWDDPHGAPWAVPWGELAAVAISKHTPMQVGSESLSDKLSGAATEKMLGERAHVRLDFYPADPGFAGRHPELAHLWERQGVQGGYRLPLGGNVKFIPTIAQAMAQFAPGIYRGVQKTEGVMGLS